MSPRQHFIENDSKREQVASLIRVLTQYLLRRHVGDRADYLTGLAQRIRCRVIGPGQRRSASLLASPKSSTFT